MGRKNKMALLAGLFLLFTNSVCAFELGTKSFFDNPPPARMLYPTGENASLQGKNSLEFQWRDSIPINTGGFDFRLYKGYVTSEPNLAIKQMLEGDVDSFSVPADKFENGAVYTWTLTRIDDEGRKSDKIYNSFKVSK